MWLLRQRQQFCVKVMRAKFAEFRPLFSRKFAEISQRNFARPLSLNVTKFRGDLCEISCLRKRNFGLTKLRRSENSRFRNLRKRKFRNTVYDASSLNLMRTLKTGNALNRYTVASLRSIPRLPGLFITALFATNFIKSLTTLVDNGLLRIL